MIDIDFEKKMFMASYHRLEQERSTSLILKIFFFKFGDE